MFPLPLLALEPRQPRKESCRKFVLRRQKSMFLNSCITSLNELHGCQGPFASVRRSNFPSHQVHLLPFLTAAVDRFCRRLRLTPELTRAATSISDVRCNDDCFPYLTIADATPSSEPDPPYLSGVLTPLVAANVARPSAVAHLPLLDLLPPHLATWYASPTFVVCATCLPRTFPAVPLLTPPQEYVQLLLRLLALDMVRTSPDRPVVVNGLFGTEKPDGRIRLIIDARAANFFFCDPPGVSLPTPDLLSRLAVDPGEDLFVAKADLEAFYHQLRTPEWMWDFFGLPPVSASALGLASAEEDFLLYPRCTTLPMGSAFAVALAQAAHLHVLSRSPLLPQSLFLCPGASELRVTSYRWTLYIDDFLLFGLHRNTLVKVLREYLRIMAEVGLPVSVKKTSPPSIVQEALGLRFDRNTVGVDPQKLFALCLDTAQIVLQNSSSPKHLQSVVGRWNWALLVRRPALSALAVAYKFVQKYQVHPSQPRPLWPSLRSELFTLIGLAPLLFVYTHHCTFPRIFCTDASSKGVGVVEAVFPSPSPPPRDFFQNSANWRVVLQQPWQWAAHINELELRGVFMALRSLLLSPLTCPSCALSSSPLPPCACLRLRIFVDSAVVEGVLRKGRSSAWPLAKIARRITALLLTSGLRLNVDWISTDINPADGPSRNFEPPGAYRPSCCP